MGKSQETEHRAWITKGERADLIRKISKMGARRLGESELLDVYLCPKRVRSFSETEMIDVGSLSTRLRRQKFGSRIEETLNLKEITKRGDHTSWKEYEVGVSSLPKAQKILERLGYKRFCTIRKRRLSYRLRDMTLEFEDIPGFGHALEIEVMTTRARAEATKRRIMGFMEGLGVKRNRMVKKSLTNAILRKRSRF